MPHIQFVHQGRRQADLLLVIALWHELMREWHPEREPARTAMVCGHVTESMAAYLKNNPGKACSFETVLRLASGVLNGMHATKPFFAHPDNATWFEPIERRPKAVRLTQAAIDEWNNASAPAREAALVAARARLEADLESDRVMVALQPHERMQAPARPGPAPIRLAGDGSRIGYLASLVHQIHEEPYQPAYRKNAFGAPVTGWDARLRAYFWPLPAQDYARTSSLVQQLVDRARTLSEAVTDGRVWSQEEGRMAVALAHDIFSWGGVPQQPDTVTPATVRQVFQAALDNDANATARMNSGWTKVAAFATAHLEEDGERHPQAIWDSRVATAIIGRLDAQLDRDADLGQLFGAIGTMPGQGGTRPRPLANRWRSGYGRWSAQVAGSAVVREIRDILNRGDYPKMPLPDGGEGPWTTRGVEMVLFMDGY